MTADQSFADALRAAVDARGLSLDRVRAHLLAYGHDVSVATLSYWQTGRSVPVRRASVQALGALEVVLQVPRGSLAAKLPTNQGRRTGADSRLPSGLGFANTEANRIAREFGVPWSEGARRVLLEDRLVVGPERRAASHLCASLIIAERDGFDRTLVAYASNEPGVLPVITAGHGCHVERTATVLRETLLVAELVFDRPLRSGEPHRYDHTIDYDGPVRVRDWQRRWVGPIHQALIEVRFQPDDLPSQVRTYAGPEEARLPTEPVPLRGDSILLLAEGFGPGLTAVEWAFPDEPQRLTWPGA